MAPAPAAKPAPRRPAYLHVLNNAYYFAQTHFPHVFGTGRVFQIRFSFYFFQFEGCNLFIKGNDELSIISRASLVQILVFIVCFIFGNSGDTISFY